MFEATDVAPNVNRAAANEKDRRDSSSVDNVGITPSSGVATLDTSTIGEKHYAGWNSRRL